MAWPTYLELAEFCVDAQLIDGFPTDYTLYETAIAAAIAKWQQLTGWKPFLAPAEDESRVYREWTPSMLDLRGGYVSITSITYDTESSPAVLHEDFELKPDGGSPTRFLRLWRLPSRYVTVVGKPGYSTECPDDVRRAILAYGASQVAKFFEPNGPVTRIRQGDVEYQYAYSGSDNPTSQASQWSLEFHQTAKTYSRRSLA